MKIQVVDKIKISTNNVANLNVSQRYDISAEALRRSGYIKLSEARISNTEIISIDVWYKNSIFLCGHKIYYKRRKWMEDGFLTIRSNDIIKLNEEQMKLLYAKYPTILRKERITSIMVEL